MKKLFDYCSPVTLEGTIVSIADEIAQVTHDIEDLRRLSSFNEMLNFYNIVEDTLSNLCNQRSEESELIEVCSNFSKVLTDTKEKNSLVIKVERIYTKLILSLCIPTVGNLIYKLWDTEDRDNLSFLLKQYYTGSFEDLLELSTHLSIEQNTKDKLQCLCDIFKAYKKIPTCMTDIARWDIKGNEMCLELANTLYGSLFLTQELQMETEQKINLHIFKSDLRPHLNKSYLSGLKLGEELGLNDSESIAKKCLIWDYIAGMTDSFILKEYGSFSFKRVEL